MSYNDFYCGGKLCIVLYRKGVKNCFPFFCRDAKVSLRSSKLIVYSSSDTYMPIFVSLRLANSSINSDKQTNKILAFNIEDTSALRLLALHGLRTLRIRRVTLRAPGVTQSNLFWEFFVLYKYCKQKLTNNFS